MEPHGKTKHGMALVGRQDYSSRHPVYSSWVNMRQRCNNPKNPNYVYYGGRGIKICKRWNDFSNFLTDMGEPPDGYTIDRINPDGNYSPGNCRWASRKQQSRNRKFCRTATYNGVTKTIGEWADQLPINITRLNLYKRLFVRKWDVERAFTQPLKGK